MGYGCFENNSKMKFSILSSERRFQKRILVHVILNDLIEAKNILNRDAYQKWFAVTKFLSKYYTIS